VSGRVTSRAGDPRAAPGHARRMERTDKRAAFRLGGRSAARDRLSHCQANPTGGCRHRYGQPGSAASESTASAFEKPKPSQPREAIEYRANMPGVAWRAPASGATDHKVRRDKSSLTCNVRDTVKPAASHGASARPPRTAQPDGASSLRDGVLEASGSRLRPRAPRPLVPTSTGHQRPPLVVRARGVFSISRSGTKVLEALEVRANTRAHEHGAGVIRWATTLKKPRVVTSHIRAPP